MDNLHSSKAVKNMLAQRGLRFNKALGQNFLVDEGVLDNIINAAQITDDTCVLEIGPGIGVLTYELAKRAKKVVTVEIDKNLIPVLNENLSEFDNVTIVNQDILKVDLKQVFAEHFDGKKVKVIANLPYYITTPIIMKLLEEKPGLDSIVVMIQKEVADRLTAKPATKQYGAITLAVNYYCNPGIVCMVPPTSFVPMPKVWSSVIRLDVLDSPNVQVNSEKLFFRLIKASFGQRRKTFLNSVGNDAGLNICKEDIKNVLNKLGFSETLRGETLNLVEFAQISNELFG